jgi:hypothetical protein
MFRVRTLRRCLLPLMLAAGCAIAAETPAPLFTETEPLQMTLSGPFGQIDDERNKDNEYEGTLGQGDAVLDVEYSVRGNYRLREDICEYSQLWLNLRRGQLEDSVFAGQNRLKLVVQCDDSANARAYIAREEQAYRLFNILSPNSFLTRIVEVTFNDPDRPRASRTHLGILLEHKDRLEERLGLEAVEQERFAVREHEAAQANLVALFMFMLSNTDYSMLTGPPGEMCCHNIEVFSTGAAPYLAIPYDFDSTGYVNPGYATPSTSIGQRSIRERIYRGFCVDEAVLQANLELFNARREQMNAVIREARFQPEREAERTLDYVDGFFGIINDAQRLERQVRRACR